MRNVPLVEIFSFGYHHRTPPPARFLTDVCWMPNPFNEPTLKDLSGLDAPTQRWLLGQKDVELTIGGMVLSILPTIRALARQPFGSYMDVAIGCKGGHDRSVAVAQILKERLNDGDLDVPARAITNHLDIHKRGGR